MFQLTEEQIVILPTSKFFLRLKKLLLKRTLCKASNKPTEAVNFCWKMFQLFLQETFIQEVELIASK